MALLRRAASLGPLPGLDEPDEVGSMGPRIPFQLRAPSAPPRPRDPDDYSNEASDVAPEVQRAVHDMPGSDADSEDNEMASEPEEEYIIEDFLRSLAAEGSATQTDEHSDNPSDRHSDKHSEHDESERDEHDDDGCSRP